MNCPQCSSTNLHNKGLVSRKSGTSKRRFKCKDCGTNFYNDIHPTAQNIFIAPATNPKQPRTWVISSAVSCIDANQALIKTLENYANYNNAELIIIPIKYQIFDHEEYFWDAAVEPYLLRDNLKLANGLKLLGGINVSPSLGNPLSGMEPFSKGDSVIIAHPQIMMKTIAVNHTDKPAIIHTTGCVTDKIYTSTKQGEKAVFNHSYAALVVEEDFDIDGFHVRVLNSDESGAFYDIDKFYDGDTVVINNEIPAVVLGDEHIVHIDPAVTRATFTNDDSIVNTLRPRYIVRHDVLDFYAANHHHKYKFFTQYAKFMSKKNIVEDELHLTIKYLSETTPEWAESILISSNHNDHLCRWLEEVNPKVELWNAKLYHQLMFLMLEQTTMGYAGAEYPNPFELWTTYTYNPSNIKFVSGYESFKVHDIELAYHGHQGVNGSRGSGPQFSKLGMKTIVGHSHSPSIFGSCYTVGHSCMSKLEYNSGPSSWGQAHCLIQPNGKRQMIFIHDGKWRR